MTPLKCGCTTASPTGWLLRDHRRFWWCPEHGYQPERRGQPKAHDHDHEQHDHDGGQSADEDHERVLALDGRTP